MLGTRRCWKPEDNKSRRQCLPSNHGWDLNTIQGKLLSFLESRESKETAANTVEYLYFICFIKSIAFSSLSFTYKITHSYRVSYEKSGAQPCHLHFLSTSFSLGLFASCPNCWTYLPSHSSTFELRDSQPAWGTFPGVSSHCASRWLLLSTPSPVLCSSIHPSLQGFFWLMPN